MLTAEQAPQRASSAAGDTSIYTAPVEGGAVPGPQVVLLKPVYCQVGLLLGAVM